MCEMSKFQSETRMTKRDSKTKNSTFFLKKKNILSVFAQKKHYMLYATETKLALLEKDSKKVFAHPHYWASFILIGNWRRN